MFQRVLAATDFSPASQPALEEASRIAAECRARLIILHVYEVPALASLSNAPASVYEDFERAVRDESQQKLAALVAQARSRKVEADGLLRQGPADEEILDTAKKEKADLIVMGTHARRGPARMLLGSVASSVVSRSSCPVLTVRTKPAESREASPAAAGTAN